MATFKEKDNFSKMKIGDTLEMKGETHEVISSHHVYGNLCAECSMLRNYCSGIICGSFYFKLKSK